MSSFMCIYAWAHRCVVCIGTKSYVRVLTKVWVYQLHLSSVSFLPSPRFSHHSFPPQRIYATGWQHKHCQLSRGGMTDLAFTTNAQTHKEL